MTVAEWILSQNHTLKFDASGMYTNPAKGVNVHEIDLATANSIADLLTLEAQNYQFPLDVALAAIDIESVFDPHCENGNFLGSNKERSLKGFDMGLCQIKIKYIIGINGIATVAQATDYAFDIKKAIPHFFEDMANRMDYVQSIGWEKDTMDDKPTLTMKDGTVRPNPFYGKMVPNKNYFFTNKNSEQRAHNIYWATTTLYNFGIHGGTVDIETDKTPGYDEKKSHGDHVVHLAHDVSTKCGLPFSFADIVKDT